MFQVLLNNEEDRSILHSPLHVYINVSNRLSQTSTTHAVSLLIFNSINVLHIDLFCFSVYQ